MRKLLFFWAVSGAIALGPTGWAATQSVEPSLLGIPFGGELRLSPCPKNTDHAKAPCWIDKPFVHAASGAKLGYAFLPNPGGRPEWAAHAMFHLQLDRHNRVSVIKVETFHADNRLEIAESISRRFGKPARDELWRTDVAWANWRSPQGYAELRCTRECVAEFRTAAAQQAYDEENSARERRNAERPVAP